MALPRHLSSLLALSMMSGAQAHQAIARAVGFVCGLPRGAVNVPIVDGPGADVLVAAMGRGIAAGGMTLSPCRVSVGALAASNLRVIIVPEGLGASHTPIATVARSQGRDAVDRHGLHAFESLRCGRFDFAACRDRGLARRRQNRRRVLLSRLSRDDPRVLSLVHQR